MTSGSMWARVVPDTICFMKLVTVVLAVLLLDTWLFAQASFSHGNECSLSPDQLNTLLGLPFMKFDQDQSGGWRAVSNHGCELTAAMLIDTYVADAPSELTVTEREDLSFHAGQLYGMAGLNKLAARRMVRSLNLHEGADTELAWNAYVLATVAFLQGDREELLHQRQLLAAAKPTTGNKMNLAVVDGLIQCFDKPYKYAYSSCRPSAK